MGLVFTIDWNPRMGLPFELVPRVAATPAVGT